MIAVVLMILNIKALGLVTDLMVWVALILTVVSLVDYVAKNHKILTEGTM